MNDNDDKVLQILEELKKETAATGAPKGLPFEAGVNAWMIDNNPNDPMLKVPTPSKPQESSQAAVKSNGVTDTPWSSYAGEGNDDNVLRALEKMKKKAVTASAKSELDYLNQFTDAYTPAPITKEEQERRTRAANAVAGVGALGNAANAISNLIFAGKGAPSQTLPQTVDASAGIRELDETERVRRNEIYQRAKERIAEKRAQDEFKQNMEIKMAEFGLKAQEAQIRMANIAAEMDLAIQRGETEKYNTLYKQYLAEEQFFKNSIAPVLTQLDMSKTKSETNENNAQAASALASANASNARAERTRMAETVNLYYKDKSGKGKGVIKIRKSDWGNAGVLGNIADSLGLKITWDKNGNGAYIAALPEPLKDMEEKKGYYTKEQIQLIIGEALNHHPSAEEIISEYGADVEEYSPNRKTAQTNKNGDKQDDKYPKYEGSKDK